MEAESLAYTAWIVCTQSFLQSIQGERHFYGVRYSDDCASCVVGNVKSQNRRIWETTNHLVKREVSADNEKPTVRFTVSAHHVFWPVVL